MRISDKHRSMIATAFVAAYDHKNGVVNKRRSLCCGPDARGACASIVGKKHADALRSWCYEELGCGGFADTEYQDQNEQYMLDKISALEELKA